MYSGKGQHLSRLPALYLCVGSWERILSTAHFIRVTLCKYLCEHLARCICSPIFWTSGVQCEQIGNEKRENTKSWAGKGRELRRQTHFLFPPDQVPVTHYKCVTCLVLQKSRYAASLEGCNASPTKPGLNWKSFVLFGSALTHRSQAVQPAPRQPWGICGCKSRGARFSLHSFLKISSLLFGIYNNGPHFLLMFP